MTNTAYLDSGRVSTLPRALEAKRLPLSSVFPATMNTAENEAATSYGGQTRMNVADQTVADTPEPVKADKAELAESDRRVFRLTKETRGHYLAIENAALEDPRLSFRAKGMLAYLLSRSPDWVVRPNHLATVSKDKIHCVQTALKELERQGYARLVTLKGKGGRIMGKSWQIFERPSLDPCKTGLCTDEAKNRLSVNQLLPKTDRNTKEGRRRHRQATGVAVGPVPESDSATAPNRKRLKIPGSVSDVVALAFSLPRFGCNPERSRELLDAYGDRGGDFTRWPALGIVEHVETHGWPYESEALRVAFQWVFWNNRKGWEIKANWQSAFCGFVKHLDGEREQHGAVDVPANWIAHIAEPNDFGVTIQTTQDT